MGLGPVYATRKALAKIGFSLKDINIIELNEAFAAQVLSVFEEMPEFKENEDKINPNGGAIAFGHPISATGGIILTKLLYEMKREKWPWISSWMRNRGSFKKKFEKFMRGK